MRFFFTVLALFVLISVLAQAITAQILKSEKINVKFKSSHADLAAHSKLMVIYNFRNDTVFASIEKSKLHEFFSKNISYEIVENNIVVNNSRKLASLTGFDYYPKHSEYVDFIRNLVQTYPRFCTLIEYGKSVKGRGLYVLRINADTLVPKPSVMYSSTMHGDETGGFVLMLRLSDYLLKNYGIDTFATRLLNNTDIWINPLANPDGAYGDEDEIIIPTRENANGVDLNRNFPDPFNGAVSGTIQPENRAMMHLISSGKFVLSANFHSGAEVVNYPWDAVSRLHPDDTWFKYVSEMYADTVKKYGRANYFTSVTSSGVINGYEWYPVHGGRQDFVTCWNYGRELTIEIDNNFVTPADQLNNLWNYNYRSLLNFLNQATYGIHGMVLDSVTRKPVKAKIEVLNHDIDSSFVFSDVNGRFYRLIQEGNYSLKISAENYSGKEISGVQVAKNKTTHLEVSLNYNSKSELRTGNSLMHCRIYPNPAADFIIVPCNYRTQITISDLSGRVLLISAGESEIDIRSLKKGIYILHQNQLRSVFVKN